MKDILGHGSNARGGRSNEGGGQPVSSNVQAGRALLGALKVTQAPPHPAMKYSPPQYEDWGMTPHAPRVSSRPVVNSAPRTANNEYGWMA